MEAEKALEAYPDKLFILEGKRQVVEEALQQENREAGTKLKNHDKKTNNRGVGSSYR
jgi:hypothetical protein